jgi:hypothetical protein
VDSPVAIEHSENMCRACTRQKNALSPEENLRVQNAAPLEELRPIHGALYEAHVGFVNAARRSLDPSQEHLVQALGGTDSLARRSVRLGNGDGTAG